MPAHIPSYWMPYFQVATLDASTAKAKALGARVMVGPQDIPNTGRFTIASDPQGAVFDVRVHTEIVMSIFSSKPLTIPSARRRCRAARAHAGARGAFRQQEPHHAAVPDGLERAVFGMGCFWGAEKKFWNQRGVYSTAVGYTAGPTPNPTYREVCTGGTGHNEVVLVVFDPKVTSYDELLKVVLGKPQPDAGHAAGHDVGTQYRSGIYYVDEAQQRRRRALA